MDEANYQITGTQAHLGPEEASHLPIPFLLDKVSRFDDCNTKTLCGVQYGHREDVPA